MKNGHSTGLTSGWIVGVSLLRGRTEYGDSIEDEWVVVWLLRELTRQSADIWVKVCDADGEFLLIEAAGTLPRWCEPEVAENRVGSRFLLSKTERITSATQVWIHNGELAIIQPKSVARHRTDETISLGEARQIILTEPKRLMYSISIEEEAFYRLRNYPQQISESMHHARITIPRKVAFLLHQKPAYIAPATEAFYLRDPIALKPLRDQSRDKLIFPPDDLVTVSVKFPRVGYAQIKSQEFPAPAAWADTSATTGADEKEVQRAETGMKVSCGFEMLLSDVQHQDQAAVREMKMLLEDVERGAEQLPTNAEMEGWEQSEDGEGWLDISFDDLPGEPEGGEGRGAGKKHGWGDTAAQANLRRMAQQFEKFLNDEAGPDGAGLFGADSDSSSDDTSGSDEDLEEAEMSLGEDEFTAMMGSMMGMPGEVMGEVMHGPLATRPRPGPSRARPASNSASAPRREDG